MSNLLLVVIAFIFIFLLVTSASDGFNNTAKNSTKDNQASKTLTKCCNATCFEGCDKMKCRSSTDCAGEENVATVIANQGKSCACRTRLTKSFWVFCFCGTDHHDLLRLPYPSVLPDAWSRGRLLSLGIWSRLLRIWLVTWLVRNELLIRVETSTLWIKNGTRRDYYLMEQIFFSLNWVSLRSWKLDAVGAVKTWHVLRLVVHEQFFLND